MNRFTNKNGGILPFQMIKLAAGGSKRIVDAAGDALQAGRDALQAGRDIIFNSGNKGGVGARSAEASKQYLNKQFGQVNDGVSAVGRKVDDLGTTVKGIGDHVGAMGPKLDALSASVKDILKRGDATDEQLLKLSKDL